MLTAEKTNNENKLAYEWNLEEGSFKMTKGREWIMEKALDELTSKLNRLKEYASNNDFESIKNELL